ncbi:hypothetical protein GGH13_006191, partial [Coemansia sp. S155-1]
MYLHGHAFQIIELGSLVNQLEPVLRYSEKCNAPMKRDTFVVPVDHYAKLRFRADNPGVWLLHCHMDVHFGMGMALTFFEAPDVLRQHQKVPDSMLELCRAQGIRTEGNKAGNAGPDLAGLSPPPTTAFQNGRPSTPTSTPTNQQATAALLLLIQTQSVLAKRVVVNWDVGYVNVNRDETITRRAIGVNGALPIPPVFATKGDTLILNVANSLDETTSVHAHGLFQNGTSYLDGPAMVNQCGIPPGESFSYEYMIDQPGTYWLHGHDHHQNSDGFRAPLIIYDSHNPFDYDEDILLSFEDWYKEEFAERAKITLDPSFP